MSPADPAAILTVRAVSHAFGARQALNGVSLDVNPGEIYALLGPNGAGKTTLARVICGRIKPAAGEVRLAGRDPCADGAARTALGLAPQALALYPTLTVAENLEAFARLAGLKGKTAAGAVAAAMRVTRVADRAETQVRVLSGGYQRRVNIAAAILAGPRLLVLDEPTVGVDLAAREAVGEVLGQLKAHGVGVMLITHDLEQAGALADRVGYMRDGSKVLEGAPAQLIAEAFGASMEVEVAVGGLVDVALEARLGAEGLSPGRDAGAFTCLDNDGYGRAAALAGRLQTLGIEVREIRVRRPSLANLTSLMAEPRAAA